jgi:hypothetical protein
MGGSAGLALEEVRGWAANGYKPQSLASPVGIPVSLERLMGESRVGQKVTAATLPAFALVLLRMTRTRLHDVIAYIESLSRGETGVGLPRV